MIKIIDTYAQIVDLFDSNGFCFTKWESYMNSIYDGSAHLFQGEAEAYILSGKYTFEKDFLPVLNAVSGNPCLDILHQSFLAATVNLNQRIIKEFGRELDVDVVLYMGLCNAAGRVDTINGRHTVLLGVEKIIELGWHGLDSMYSLIYHELGHIYHAQYGRLKLDEDTSEINFIWQMFTEGIAMYFEQRLVGDLNYFHQGGADWKQWCDDHFIQILRDFDKDLTTMSQFDQRYFGDWADFHGHGDVGYYLGTRFVHQLLKNTTFDELIKLHVEKVCELYKKFVLLYGEGEHEK